MTNYVFAAQVGGELRGYHFALAESVKLEDAVHGHAQAAFLALKPPRDTLSLYVMEDETATRLLGIAMQRRNGEVVYQEMKTPT